MSESETQPTQNGLNVDQWLQQKAQGAQIVADELPSGLKIRRYKTVSIERLVFAGKVPIAAFMGENGQINDQLELDIATVIENIADYIEMINAIFVAAIAEPAIGDITDPTAEPPALALSLFDDELPDKLYILEKVTGGVEAVRPFPAESK